MLRDIVKSKSSAMGHHTASSPLNFKQPKLTDIDAVVSFTYCSATNKRSNFLLYELIAALLNTVHQLDIVSLQHVKADCLLRSIHQPTRTMDVLSGPAAISAVD